MSFLLSGEPDITTAIQLQQLASYELGAVLAYSIIALYNSIMLFILTVMYFIAISNIYYLSYCHAILLFS